MPCIVKTGVVSHDNTCLQAEMTRQVAVAAAANQAAVTAAEVTYYRAVKASALTNGLSEGVVEATLALRSLNATP
jgi:hypothetical protein